jgi:hypothetical protein
VAHDLAGSERRYPGSRHRHAAFAAASAGGALADTSGLGNKSDFEFVDLAQMPDHKRRIVFPWLTPYEQKVVWVPWVLDNR